MSTRIRQHFYLPSGITMLLIAGVIAGCSDTQSGQQQFAPEVAVRTARRAAVPLDLTYAARTVGSREVEVRARVGGILLKRLYREGTAVQEGQRLFLIDPEPARARAASARAAVAVATARLEEARRQKDRILPLFEQKLVSQSQRDEAMSAFDVAQANVQAAESNLRTAELDLEYTDVRAPISGLSSREVLSEGSLVSADQNASPLTRIVQVDPLYIEFSVPQTEANLIRNSLNAAKGARPPSVKVILDDGAEYSESAKLTFIDNAVDERSGTVMARAVMSNPQAALLPGQFVRARVDGVALAQAIAIPRKALMANGQQHFVWTVDGEQKVSMRPVAIGRNLGNDILIESGLNDGERYIVEGVLKVQPGMQVNAIALDEAKPVVAAPASEKEAA